MLSPVGCRLHGSIQTRDLCIVMRTEYFCPHYLIVLWRCSIIGEQKNLDLVKIAPQAKPPVCKIMDYGKYRFEQAKREKEARKNQHIVDIKEVRLSLNIDTHDFNTKLNNALKFIKHGDKVKVSIRFRGREMGHPEIGLETMKRFAEACAEVAVVEKPAKLEGRNMLMFLAPKPNK